MSLPAKVSSSSNPTTDHQTDRTNQESAQTTPITRRERKLIAKTIAAWIKREEDAGRITIDKITDLLFKDDSTAESQMSALPPREVVTLRYLADTLREATVSAVRNFIIEGRVIEQTPKIVQGLESACIRILLPYAKQPKVSESTPSSSSSSSSASTTPPFVFPDLDAINPAWPDTQAKYLQAPFPKRPKCIMIEVVAASSSSSSSSSSSTFTTTASLAFHKETISETR